MKRSIPFIILIIIVAAFVTACTTSDAKSAGIKIEDQTQEPNTQTTGGEDQGTTGTSTATTEHTIEITANGFVPSSISVNAGDTVTWANEDTSAHRVASNPHPVHTGYPTTGGCVGSTFDSCTNLEPGDSWSFTFDETGTWGYHDHLNPGTSGTVIVE